VPSISTSMASAIASSSAPIYQTKIVSDSGTPHPAQHAHAPFAPAPTKPTWAHQVTRPAAAASQTAPTFIRQLPDEYAPQEYASTPLSAGRVISCRCVMMSLELRELKVVVHYSSSLIKPDRGVSWGREVRSRIRTRARNVFEHRGEKFASDVAPAGAVVDNDCVGTLVARRACDATCWPGPRRGCRSARIVRSATLLLQRWPGAGASH
jgi:hypothetical protein